MARSAVSKHVASPAVVILAGSLGVLATTACNAVLGITHGDPRLDGGNGGTAGSGGGGVGGGTGGATTGPGGAGGEGGDGGDGGDGQGGQAGAGGGEPTCGDAATFAGAFDWKQTSLGSESWVRALAYGVDEQTLYVAGDHTDRFEFGGEVSTSTDGAEDIFIAALDAAANGAPSWAHAFAFPGVQRVEALAIDPVSGDLLIVGHFQQTLQLGDAASSMTASGSSDVLLARFTAAGAHVWSRKFGDGEDQRGLAVRVNGLGQIVVVAYAVGAIDWGTNTRGVTGLQALHVALLDGAGDELASVAYRMNFQNGVDASVAIGPSNEIAVAGVTDRKLMASDVYHGGNSDAFVVGFDASLGYRFSRLYGEKSVAGEQRARAVAIDCAGALWVTGAFTREIELGVSLHNDVSTGDFNEANLFVAKLDGDDGAVLWSGAWGDDGRQEGLSIGTDATGNVIVAGLLIDGDDSAGVDLGGGPLPPATVIPFSPYRTDMFLLALTPAGAHRFSARYGANEWLLDGEGTVGPSGRVALGGRFFTEAELGAELLQASGHDLFVVQLEP